jgi:hypothetical protein
MLERLAAPLVEETDKAAPGKGVHPESNVVQFESSCDGEKDFENIRKFENGVIENDPLYRRLASSLPHQDMLLGVREYGADG